MTTTRLQKIVVSSKRVLLFISGIMPVVFGISLLATLILAAEIQDVRDKKKVEFLPANYDFCGKYDEWKSAFQKRKLDVIEDRVDYLSWKEFVAIQNGYKVEEMESFCFENSSKVKRVSK